MHESMHEPTAADETETAIALAWFHGQALSPELLAALPPYTLGEPLPGTLQGAAAHLAESMRALGVTMGDTLRPGMDRASEAMRRFTAAVEHERLLARERQNRNRPRCSHCQGPIVGDVHGGTCLRCGCGYGEYGHDWPALSYALWGSRIDHLRRVVPDGPLLAPVWLHHVVKLLTSCSVAWMVYGALAGLGGWHISASGAGLVGGFGWFIVLRTAYMIRPQLAHDTSDYGVTDRLGDYVVDFSLSMVAAGFGYAADGAFITAATILVSCLVSWWGWLLHSRP